MVSPGVGLQTVLLRNRCAMPAFRTLHRDMLANVVGATRLAPVGVESPPAVLLQELEPHQLCPERLLHIGQFVQIGLQLGDGPFKDIKTNIKINTTRVSSRC